jgi:hypothetical protein
MSIYMPSVFSIDLLMAKIAISTDVSVDSIWAGRNNGGIGRAVHWIDPFIVLISYHQ